MTRRDGVGYVQKETGDELIRRESNVALWKFRRKSRSASGYGVYLYKDEDWFEQDPNGPWLLYAKRKDLQESEKQFREVRALFSRK
jgi:hypothetical protein